MINGAERIDDCDPPCVPVNNASDTPWQSKIAVKISIYKDWHVEEVIYYRYAMPLPIVRKWQWYFEYLAALVKVHNPRRTVELIIVSQDVLCGDDYIAKKTKTLLQAKRPQLKQAQNKRINDDLFGHTSSAHQSKLDRLRDEIEALERGEFRYYVPQTYINKIKKWVK